ncbi:MAG: pyruvate kinase [Gammaproteobacteria bacterium]|nr:pyruvate kinase [Gammaproteobacteria bacterium]
MDLVRLNYSHGDRDSHATRVERVRRVTRKLGREVGIIADLQGPKIRLQRFKDGSIELAEGDRFIIDARLKANAGDHTRVGVTYKALPDDVKKGDTLLIDDGRIVLSVERVKGSAVYTTVVVGGTLSDNKGVNRAGGGLSAKALTAKDRADLKHAIGLGVDYIAISFPRSAEDIHAARRLVKRAGGSSGIIAKLERAEAVDEAESIISASDAIMVARGDLGVEIGDAALPPVQKQLIATARSFNCTVITATQMMESMIDSMLPTRAEVFDVANAVIDGTDAVMLSGETSVGRYPDQVVSAMARICIGSERHWHSTESVDIHHHDHYDRIDQAIAMSTMYCANRVDAKAIAALTETGNVAMWMSQMDSSIPIFALSPHLETLRRVTLFRGVHPVAFDAARVDYRRLTEAVIAELQSRQAVEPGDKVIITKGDLLGATGGTNGMKIVEVGGAIAPDA